jgi:tRNA(Ile)-lysidine synthase
LSSGDDALSLTPSGLLDQLRPWRAAPRWWLGYSGGLDSTVLLHLLAGLSQQAEIPPLRVIHVNHGLQEQAEAWADHCRVVCADLGLELQTREVAVKLTGDGPEAAARVARYGLFESELGAGDVLLLAHHADDQVETFFLRLMRGAGTQGLQGMPATRALGQGALVRPLLDYPRVQLQAYAREHGLNWIEDGSNQDTTLDRNYLRHEVLPQLEARWPGYRRSISQAMETVADTAAGFAEHYRELLAAARGERHGEAALDLVILSDCSPGLLTRLLRQWLAELGVPVPGRKPLQELVHQLAVAAPEAAPQLSFSGYCLQRFQQHLYLYRPRPAPVDFAPQRLLPGQSVQVPGLGQLAMVEVASGGTVLPAAGYWNLRLRKGGERCQPAGRGHSQSLKKLLQEHAVPPWQRQAMPLVYAAETLVEVPGLWVCEGFEAAPEQPGFRLQQQPG